MPVVTNNDLIDIIFNVAAELQPIADRNGSGETWAAMIQNRTPESAFAACVMAPHNKASARILAKVASAVQDALEWGASRDRIYISLSTVRRARITLGVFLPKTPRYGEVAL
jgi:hypothetical protein